MKASFDAEQIKNAIKEALPDTDQASAEPNLAPGFSYVPQSHALALDWDISIVSGIRGAGKSFWWTYLASSKHRTYLAKAFPEVGRIDADRIAQGFGGVRSDSFPSPEAISRMQKKRIESRFIWQSVVGVGLCIPQLNPKAQRTWEERAVWVREHLENFDIAVRNEDHKLGKEGKRALIMFDALDRLSENWKGIRPIAKALFQTALEMRSYQNIRLKLFARPDMLEDEEITAFPDASKLLSKKLELNWRRADLYALLFQRLGNAPEYGDYFRNQTKKDFSLLWRKVGEGPSWVLPVDIRQDEDMQKELFHAIAGPTMAKGESGHKRGLPYTWLVNHLMDSHEQVSPRSFFAALREAARTAHDRAWGFALDPRSIQEGVARASEIRKNEVVFEDYPWVSVLMEPLGDRRLIIPCEIDDIKNIWQQEGTLEKLRKRTSKPNEVKLPPRHLEEGAIGIIRDLKEIGIVDRLQDGRIQMPDVYRIAFGLGRKGGVKPLK
jgi:hypothetical protein